MTSSACRPPLADLVLPCLDEAEALPWVLARVPGGWRAIVVDNGSTDGSADIARRLGATVVHETRRGFGAACHAGLLAARAELVCFCDCDASMDPGLLAPMAGRVAAGRTDLLLGRRRPQGRGAWPAHARAGNFALARMLRRRTGLRLHDLGPMRVARREALLGLELTDRRSGYPLQTLPGSRVPTGSAIVSRRKPSIAAKVTSGRSSCGRWPASGMTWSRPLPKASAYAAP
ncbi:glycosyltransferase family 2 protein [Streptomyces sp. NPDC048258]|uniref:glycosyltransferase family 2 protein n=1 Tax=Streptomyces sp. NPDC048258 TaxID=3365527 RepID=UPI00371EFF4D